MTQDGLYMKKWRLRIRGRRKFIEVYHVFFVLISLRKFVTIHPDNKCY